MTVLGSAIKTLFPPERKPFGVILVGLLGAVAIGVAAADKSILTLGALLGVLVLVLLLKWPDATTLLVVFYIYANVGPVAIQFHNVPSYIAMGFPAVLVIPLAWHLFRRREKLIISPLFLLLLILLFIYILGAIYSSNITLATPKLVEYITNGVILYFLITNLVRTPTMLKRVVWVLLVSGAFIGGLAVFQQVTHTFSNTYGGFAQALAGASFATGPVSVLGQTTQIRLSGSIGEQNRFAQNMLMLVPLGIFQLWIYRSTWARALALLFTGLIIAGGALSFSRGAAVGFVLFIISMVFLRYIKFYQVALLALVAGLVLLMFPQYVTRLTTLSVFADVASTNSTAALNGADGAIRGRATEILAALLIFRDHPVIGVGPGMVIYYTQAYSRNIGFRYITNDPQPHSLFPGIAAESGILGLVCFLLILYVPLRDLARARKQWLVSHPDWAYMATAFFQVLMSYVITGLFLHMSYLRFFYLMLALAAVASSFKEPSPQVETVATETALVPAVQSFEISRRSPETYS